MISHFPSLGRDRALPAIRRDGGDGVAGRHGGVDCADVGEIREAWPSFAAITFIVFIAIKCLGVVYIYIYI